MKTIFCLALGTSFVYSTLLPRMFKVFTTHFNTCCQITVPLLYCT